MTTNPNDYAFSVFCGEGPIPPTHGLTKREYFAAMALQGLLADPHATTDIGYPMTAVQLADALIAELNKTAAPTR